MVYDFNANQDLNLMINNIVNSITQMAEDQVKHINRLTRIGAALSSESDLDRIFDMILEEGIDFTHADGATIYKVSDDGQFLDFAIIYNATLNIRLGGKRNPTTWANRIPLYDSDGKPILRYIVTSVYHSKTSVCFDDVYEAQDYDISGTLDFDGKSNYRCKSMLTIPLKNHEDEVLGVIQFINAMDKDKNITSFTPEHCSMLSSLASQAAIALSNRKLIESLESLLNQFIRSIAGAIERKSKYSGGHITRVATLTEMLAAKINEADPRYFGGRKFSDIELKELSMAGWMHDVGKIVTPEYIMDKSTKLETITDRIEIVLLRFDRLELALNLLQSRQAPEEFEKFLQDNVSDKLNSHNYHEFIETNKAFIQKLNFGEEFVAEEDLKHVEELSMINFEYEGKPYYLFSEDEKRNLMISGRGTLTKEELGIMHEHVSITWEMLSKLTFPKKFKNVATYAASHHEALDGSGYPRGIGAADLSLQSRIIAVADIFEALTASDRPYKKAKTLTESLTIMAFMVKDGLLDKDIVDYFLDSGLYQEYADKYIKPEYQTQVDIAAIKAKYTPQ